MLVNPVSINGNKCHCFKGCNKEEMSVIEGGYIITPTGEIIVVKDKDEHRIVFSNYINAYLENNSDRIYDTLTATKMLCELGCCVYAGIRTEYIRNELENLEKSMGSLTFPNSFEYLTDIQREICLHLISTNKSILGNHEKIFIQYGALPDNVYSKEEIIDKLTINYQKRNEI